MTALEYCVSQLNCKQNPTKNHLYCYRRRSCLHASVCFHVDDDGEKPFRLRDSK